MKSWLATHRSTICAVPHGDIVIAFDNNQVLQRRWKVRLSNEVKCNIVTIVVVFHINDAKLQHVSDIKPGCWAGNYLSAAQSIRDIDQESMT